MYLSKNSVKIGILSKFLGKEAITIRNNRKENLFFLFFIVKGRRESSIIRKLIQNLCRFTHGDTKLLNNWFHLLSSGLLKFRKYAKKNIINMIVGQSKIGLYSLRIFFYLPFRMRMVGRFFPHHSSMWHNFSVQTQEKCYCKFILKLS